MQEFASIAAGDGQLTLMTSGSFCWPCKINKHCLSVCHAILTVTSHLPWLNNWSWQLNLNVFLFSYKRYVWQLHISKLTLQTVRKTCNCSYKQNILCN